jgi:PadR family transcriptional regulator, regulatory protein PadR
MTDGAQCYRHRVSRGSTHWRSIGNRPAGRSFANFAPAHRGHDNDHMRSDCLQGTLDLMVLKTLATMGPLHGYGIARRIEAVSRDLLQMNQGTLYPALVRLEQKRFITSKWGVSENNRRAKYYTISKAGQRQLAAEEENWDRISAVMARFIHGFKEA